MKRLLIYTIALMVGLTSLGLAQAEKGNIYGTVTDTSGGVLPGVTVTISGDFGTNVTVTDDTGRFRFLNMDHGNFTVTVEMSGFATQAREIILASGVNVDLNFAMDISGVEETVTVTAETPVVDIRKLGTEETISSDELDKIPSSRDPWALMRTVPGVQVDRVNIAGSESGQQSNYQGKGSAAKNNTWSIDGIIITDMSTRGASPGYYTYDTFDEVNVTTGGGDISNATGGVHMSFVTKRGTNQPQGSFNFNWTDDKLQSSNIPDELVGDERLQGNDKADHTDNITDWSIDFGGPILKDKLWGYGSYGSNTIEIVRLTQTHDKTELTNWVGKLNWQATESDQISFFYFLNSKVKIGRSPGSGLTDAEEHLYDQGGAFPRNPHGLSKGEWNRVWNPNLISNIKAAYYSTGFTLAPRGDTDEIFDYVNQEARGNPWDRSFIRPQSTIRGDASYFTGGWGGNHEIKFGIGWKRAESEARGTHTGNKTRSIFNVRPTEDRARFYRDTLSAQKADYWSLYVGDTYSRDRWTFNIGVRFDRQTAENKPTTAPANPLIPDLLPALEFPGGGQGIHWSNLSPRFGMTYALDEDYKTVLRASFSRYHGQLQVGDAGWDSPLGSRPFLEYNWTDSNGDELIQLNEVRFDEGLQASANIDPNNPAALGSSVNQIDPDFEADIDYEAVVGLDREVIPDLAVGVAFTWRSSYNVYRARGGNWIPRIGVTADDYVLGDPISDNGYTVTPYVLRDGVSDRPEVTGGRLLTNRPDYNRNFKGIDFTLNKRLSNRWMGRVAFSFNNWKENFDGPSAYHHNRSPLDDDPQIDGGLIIRQGAGSGKTLYFTSGWQFNASGLYQLPAGFEASANLFGRQGYPRPIYIRTNLGGFEGNDNVLAVDAVDDERLPNLWNLDVRLAYNLQFPNLGSRGITLAAEFFNVLNSNTTLNRIVQANSPTFDRLEEILAPRIIRLVAKVRF